MSSKIIDTPKVVEEISWLEMKLREMYPQLFSDEFVATARQYMKRRRVGDFSIERGKVTARLNIDNEPERINFLVKKPDSSVFEKLFSDLAESSYFFAQFLAGTAPKGLGVVLDEAGVKLNLETAELRVNGKTDVEPRPSATAVLLSFIRDAGTSPFALFEVFGFSSERVLSELRLRRRNAGGAATSLFGTQQIRYKPSPLLQDSVDSFWQMSPEATKLHYHIKADELPASILKWLDPLPLNGLEEAIDRKLDECYAKVARLAQSYGLGL